MRWRSIGLAVAAIAAFQTTSAAHARAPDLATCPRPDPADGAERGRKRPLPVPANLRAMVQSNLLHFAIATLDGRTVCVDTSWMENATWISARPNDRFVYFEWYGVEAGGYFLIDRTGRGQAIDVGDKPVFSPSRGKFAAIEISESGFGSLNGFAVWQVNATGVQRLTFLDNLPQMADWRIDGWAGEACINISSFPQDKYPENVANLPKVPRTRFTARSGPGGWRVIAAKAGCPRQ